MCILCNMSYDENHSRDTDILLYNKDHAYLQIPYILCLLACLDKRKFPVAMNHKLQWKHVLFRI